MNVLRKIMNMSNDYDIKRIYFVNKHTIKLILLLKEQKADDDQILSSILKQKKIDIKNPSKSVEVKKRETRFIREVKYIIENHLKFENYER